MDHRPVLEARVPRVFIVEAAAQIHSPERENHQRRKDSNEELTLNGACAFKEDTYVDSK